MLQPKQGGGERPGRHLATATCVKTSMPMPRYDVVVHEAAIVAELFRGYVEVGVSIAELAPG